MKLQILVWNDKWKRVVMICTCKTGSRWTAMWYISHCSLQHTFYQHLFWQQHIWHTNNIWNISQDMKAKVLTTRGKLSFTGSHRDLIVRDCIKTVASNLGVKNEEKLVLYIFPVLFCALINSINYLSYMKYINIILLFCSKLSKCTKIGPEITE